MHNYKKLNVWISSISLVKNIYNLTRKFPKEEMFVLTQQLRRAAISIPSNIAEGAGRNSNAQFKNFLQISIGSCFEVETQLIISKELEYISEEELETISKELDSIMKMNHNLQKTL
ncbi:MAG: four helix bundle protein [Cloacibacterium normanense]|jgi:four helix bundle protein|uniref:Four helix bundle family protein n=1 Tax=Cloacibacterium normanense TaxID=237258 RepID=A0A1E5UG75_9FLAO|nr:four helix bundle protein [Cloacibacterium normanense]HCO20378.1 four helix bundle protein [Flavobacteriaceae bacterium]AZI68876.1 four helix bundle protein [Cloacibacterium normanense]MBF1149208.1 four helix bundle protein [Cloacibacterium normanense]OEL11890.1 four helix bundle family protein [Cloacibacterium normanense]SDO76931.1 four helix bundle protein [Cloacibacterium normanense]